MNNYPDKASLENPWWIDSTQQEITQYDYSDQRLEKTKQYITENKLTIDDYLNPIKQNNHDDFSLLFAIGKLLQDILIHNPVFQPSEKRPISIKGCIRNLVYFKPIEKYQLVYDPLLLLLLGEARCGQAAQVLIELLKQVNIKASIEQLNAHVITKITINNQEYLIDIDAFKNGIFFFKDKKTLFTRQEILNNPTIIDQFKHTGWMFRKNTRYAKNANNINFSGYVDFFMPENDGLISGKYGQKNVYYPSGVPIWNTSPTTIKENEKLCCSFNVPFANRANYFLVRIGKKPKGYSYDNLIYKNLLNETSDIEKEIKLTENEFVFTKTIAGEYYITVCAVSEHLKKNQYYIWWSDELKIIVI